MTDVGLGAVGPDGGTEREFRRDRGPGFGGSDPHRQRNHPERRLPELRFTRRYPMEKATLITIGLIVLKTGQWLNADGLSASYNAGPGIVSDVVGSSFHLTNFRCERQSGPCLQVYNGTFSQKCVTQFSRSHGDMVLHDRGRRKPPYPGRLCVGIRQFIQRSGRAHRYRRRVGYIPVQRIRTDFDRPRRVQLDRFAGERLPLTSSERVVGFRIEYAQICRDSRNWIHAAVQLRHRDREWVFRLDAASLVTRCLGDF